MPAFYAHDRFGREVSDHLQGPPKEIISKYPAQFAIGLQGPDIFFFCRPWCGRVNRYGNHLHEISAKPFFYHARKVVRQIGRDSAQYAYLMGFICHFILDSECHPYVNMTVEETGVHHLEIEEEFEKHLLRLDGEDPLAFPMGDLVPTDGFTAAAIAPFYASGITPAIVRRSLKDLRMLKRLFTAPGAFKQNLLNGIFRLSGHYAGLKGLMNQRRDNPACQASNDGLLLLFDNAVELAAEMIEDFDRGLTSELSPDKDGHIRPVPLNSRFDRNFE